jgi:LacI family transcriptional regulator
MAVTIRAVTIKEVARRAGVSVATVSRVLNRRDPVREETRAEVLAAVAALRYVPSGVARSLSMRQTDAIGVVLPDLHGEFFSEVIRGLDRVARGSGYHLLLSGSHSDPAEVEAVLRAIHGRVDGLIAMLPDLDVAALADRLPPEIPVLLLNGAEGAPWGGISIDNEGGALAVTRHLIGLGHRRIAFVGGPEKNSDARERLRGYQAGLAEAGLEEWLEAGDFSEDAGYAAGRRLLAAARTSTGGPTAVFAANDATAIGILCALREGGLAVPGDIALAGFDDIPVARYVLPALTTVHVAIDELGRRAMERLLAALSGDTASLDLRERFPATLVIRESCGARGEK